MPEINGVSVPFMPVGGANALKNNSGRLANTGKDSGSNKFDLILQDELQKVKFSNHALERLEDRNIMLKGPELEKLNEAVSLAKSKGSKEALVLMDKQAYIVSVTNNTVITVIDQNTMNNNFISNIDSAVIV
jgi:flagellar operon protein